MPRREAQLRQWLGECCGLEGYGFAPASADASFRRYFRIDLGEEGTRVVMDAPPDKEDCRPFVDVTRRLELAGVHVPHIYAQDLGQGFLLLEDLGDRLYLGELDTGNVDALYGDAITALLAIQSGNPQGLPPYDRELLEREMRLFPEWLLGAHLGLELSRAERQMLDDTFERLVHNALEQPQVLVHRDYHSRNLLLCAQRSPGVIDYQDAVLGPVTYDLVSLLRDCYVAWPQERVDAWMNDYAQRALTAGLIGRAEFDRVPLWFDLMGAQRHLKAAGIFARLNHRDAKPGYLQDIPRTLGYILSVAARRPELAPLAGFIGERVLPGLEAA
jgi:hypothetical protein